jgi:hypothetical protein
MLLKACKGLGPEDKLGLLARFERRHPYSPFMREAPLLGMQGTIQQLAVLGCRVLFSNWPYFPCQVDLSASWRDHP